MKNLIKNIISLFIFLMMLEFICSCEKSKQTYSDIKIGKQAESLTKVTIVPQSTRDIVLSGGNNKYLVNIANSKIASVRMAQDTLKVQGYFEGETYATIVSLDMEAVLKITVRPNELMFNQQELKICPKEINKTVSLGGGNIITINKNDPNDIIEYRWMNDGILTITGKHEGVASLIAYSEGVEQKELKITVESEDENGYLQEIGFYNTYGKTVGQNINPKLIVTRKEMGTLLKSTNDLNNFLPANDETYCWIPAVNNPKVGEVVTLNITANFTKEGFTSGEQKLKVIEVRKAEGLVELSGRDFKFIVPYN